MRLSKKPSVQERIRKARCSAVMVRLTAPAEANGPKYRPGLRLRAAMLEDLRRPMVAGDQDIGKRLVVAQLHVEARPQLLDQIGFQQQRFGLGRGGDDLDRHGRGDHAQDARRQRRVDAGVGGQPLADVFRLADIEHVAGGIEHAVDAGRGRRQPHRVFDRGMADRQRAFGDRLGGFLTGPQRPAGAPRRPPRRRMSRGRRRRRSRSCGGRSGWEPRRALRGGSGWSVES